MITVQAQTISTRRVTTKYGQRVVGEFLLSDGETVTVWSRANNDEMLALQPNERVLLEENAGSGKLRFLMSWAKHQKQSMTPSERMLDNYANGTLTHTQSALAPVENKSVPSSPAPAIDVMIKRHASILAKCRREVLAAMGNVGEEIVEKYAVTMFLAIQKQLAEF